MIRRSARNNVNLIERIEVGRVPRKFLERNRLLIACNALTHRIAHSFGLLVDLLEHEMLIAALLRRFRIPRHFKDFLLHRFARAIRDLDAVLADNRKLTVTENIGAARARNDGGNIRGDEVFPLTETDDERIVLFRANEHIGMRLAHERERIRALDAAQYLTHCRNEITRIHLFKQVDNDLRIRLGLELVSLRDEFFLEGQIVLNDAVVDNRKIFMTIRMGMRVHIGRPPVRRPPRMTDAERADRDAPLDLLAQRRETPHALLNADLTVLIDRNPRRIIAAIFQFGQPVQKKLRRLTISDIPDNSTHKNTSRLIEHIEHLSGIPLRLRLCPRSRPHDLTADSRQSVPEGIRRRIDNLLLVF